MTKAEEIKKIIKNGFDIELISLEFDIPLKQLKQWKEEIERSKKVAHSKMEKLRERYKKLYFRNNKVEIELPEKLSQEDIKLIDTATKTVEEKIQEMKNLENKEKREVVKSILSELKKIKDYQLTIEQAEKINMLLNSEEIQHLGKSQNDKIEYAINQTKKDNIIQLAKAIEFKLNEVENIEELKTLERKITLTMVKQNPISVGAVKSKISTKISTIQQKEASDRIRNDIPINIISIITDLAKGNIDIQKANTIIEEEAQKRLQNKQKNKFSLTEEQVKRQILTQIRTAIAEKGDKYPIQDPEKTVLQVQELCGGQINLAVSTVIENLMFRKDFEIAKNICDKYSSKNKESQMSKCIRDLKKKVRNTEIADFVLQGIYMEASIEEENKYFETIEKGIDIGNVKLEAISLGKSEDGLRSITLADIWGDEKQLEKIKYI